MGDSKLRFEKIAGNDESAAHLIDYVSQLDADHLHLLSEYLDSINSEKKAFSSTRRAPMQAE